ncbi:MAG: hypothetical protein JG781_2437 [Peptococcaceae bacterium]|jgi:phosphoribosyl 1,2-cyclic phosphodiesterase|nr:hypothetical protein [Peptococcaceae bacterium]
MNVCTLRSGSSGNAIYIETEQTRVLIDAGLSGKVLANAASQACGVDLAALDALLITHAHRDHILGAGVLARRYKLPVYATEGTWCEMSPLIGPVPPGQQYIINTDVTWEIGDLKIGAFPVSHDALEPVGYILGNGERTLGVATDSGVMTSRMEKHLRNLDVLILEANHDVELLRTGPYPWSLKKRIASILGHLSNESAGQALLRTLGGKTKKVILAHLSEENNKPALALKTVQEELALNQVNLAEVDIFVAPRYEPSPRIKI